MGREVVYVNHGQVYKKFDYFQEATPKEFSYIADFTNDPVGAVGHSKSKGVKVYESTREMRKWLLNETSGDPLTGYDLCPSVNLWYGKGYFESDPSEVDLYFCVDNSTQLQAIADYYSLEYPLSAEQSATLDNQYSVVSMYVNPQGDHFVLGAVKLVNGTPTVLKTYFAYKDEGTWTLLQRGRVFCDGAVVEEGGHYVALGTPNVRYASVSDQTSTVYVEADNYDPLVTWQAHIFDLDGNQTVKRFESSKAIRELVAWYSKGSNYDEYDKAPDVELWLGKSWVEGGETELFFHAGNRQIIDSVAAYYGLPTPYPEELIPTLDGDISKIRFKSYDVGTDDWVSLIVCGVVFADQTPIRLNLYETTRWNEATI